MRNFIGLSVLVMLSSAACGPATFVAGSEDGGDGGNNPVYGGGDGGAPDVSAPPGCDTTKLPTDNFCVVNDAEGVFASTSLGSAMNDGTKEHPLGSLDAAIKLAQTHHMKRVYACAEIYAEQVRILDGISVFGNLSCNGGTWALAPTAHAKIAAPASPAASATNITSPTRIEAVDIVSPDFTTGSQSSIALFANNAPALYVTHATIHAGTGGKGADGTNGIQLTDSGIAKNGTNAWKDGVCTGTNCTLVLVANTLAPQGGKNTCVGESGHDPGAGGTGGYPGEFQSVQFGSSYIWNAVDQGTTAGSPSTPTTQTAQGGAIGLGGSSGAAGADGTSGTSGTSFGTLSVSGYVAADGTKGSPGMPGQGGGGSGGYNALLTDWPPASNVGKYAWGEPGAGGGAGGCPGLPGTAGMGGGASFGVVAIASGFTLDNVTVESSKGGDGGAAGASSAPTAGGFGGQPGFHVPGAGNGGAGGHAGVSGNGGGGPSVGIVYDKTQPILLASTPTHGAGGAGVASGQPSPDGLSADVYQFGQ